MQEIFEKIKERLRELKTFEKGKEEYIDENGMWNDCEEAFSDGESNGRYQGYVRAINIVNEVAEEYGKDTNVSTNDGWIPCSERLPEERQIVLASVTYANPCVNDGSPVVISRYCGEEWWHNGTVIAWQPLPAPYQPKETQNE